MCMCGTGPGTQTAVLRIATLHNTPRSWYSSIYIRAVMSQQMSFLFPYGLSSQPSNTSLLNPIPAFKTLYSVSKLLKIDIVMNHGTRRLNIYTIHIRRCRKAIFFCYGNCAYRWLASSWWWWEILICCNNKWAEELCK